MPRATPLTRESVGVPETRIDGDVGHLWSYTRRSILIISTAEAVIVTRLLYTHEMDVPWGAVAGAIAYLVICGWYIWRALQWKESVLPISYEVRDGSLRVLDHHEEMRSFHSSRIVGFRMVGSMSLRGWAMSLKFEPEWPHGEIAVEIGGVAQWEELPPIMIWGRSRAHQAEATVRDALGLGESLTPSRFRAGRVAVGTVAVFGLTVTGRAALISRPNRALVALGGVTLAVLSGCLWMVISKVESARTGHRSTPGRHRRPPVPDSE